MAKKNREELMGFLSLLKEHYRKSFIYRLKINPKSKQVDKIIIEFLHEK